ncbi:MAG: LexA family transcriptional repressor, partial [Deltaproteobacteria bacterium HGW-Deltaproteobacteria-12]
MTEIKETKTSLGNKVKKAREKMGWSLKDLAHETGYPVDVLQSVEDN